MVVWRRLPGCVLAALVLLSSSPTTAIADSQSSAIVRGVVTDSVSGRPLGAARIAITVRTLSARTVGGESVSVLDPLRTDSAAAVETSTDASGRYEAAVRIAAPTAFLRLEVSARGYRPTGNALIRVRANESVDVDFETAPLDLAPAVVLRLQNEHELAKARMYRAMGPVTTPAEVATRASASHARERIAPGADEYAVPDEVFVASLPGTQFTGFIDFDEYIAGVVAAEMGDSFPFEALKVQAIASRTFALERYERTGTANGGQAYTAFFSALAQSHLAARNTSAGVMLHDGEPPTAFFSARCNGDFTLDSEDGLSCIPNGCGNPCTVGGLLPGAAPLPYVRSRSCSGHDNCSLTGEPCCDVFADGRTQHLFGHGVGMCQRGAQQFACRDGVGFGDILARYYTDVTLANAPGIAPGARVATTTGLNARAAPCDADRVVVGADTGGTVVDGPLIVRCQTLGSCVGAAGTYWTWWQVDFDDGTGGRWVVEDFIEQIAPASTAPPSCARPVSGAETPQVSDCLFILQVAIGAEQCVPECVCAPGGELPVSSADALACLVSAVGLPISLSCPCP